MEKKTISEERVICIKSELVTRYSEKVFWDPFLFKQIMDGWNVENWKLTFLPRSLAEKSYGFKQLVAYVILRSGNQFLTYERTKKSGETRLWEKFSIGVGGHLSDVDMRATSQTTLNGSTDLRVKNQRALSLFTQAALREFEEEITLSDRDRETVVSVLEKSKPEYFINDESNDVGKLHLGIVWILNIPRPEKITGKKGLTNLEFCTLEAIKKNKEYFETWSQLLIDNLENRTKS